MEKKHRSEARPKLDEVEVLRRAQATLEAPLPLEADGDCCTSTTRYEVLIGVAAHRSTIESVCAARAGAPEGETLRGYLNEQLRMEALSALERRINAALAAHWPKQVRRGAAIEAPIDCHDRPSYGQAEQAQALWVRGKAKDGTTRFYRVATAYAIGRGQRVTLAIRFVLPEDETGDVVADLWRGWRRRGLRFSWLYLDKGFASVEGFDYLQNRRQPALIAWPIRAKDGGPRALSQGNKSYRPVHTFQSAQDQAFTADRAVCRVFTTAKRTGRHQRRGEWLVFVLIALDWTPKHWRQRYRQRFGIETSYRLSQKLWGWTTSPNPASRFVLMGVGFSLLNLWVQLCWEFTQGARRGGRFLNAERFRQQRFINFLIHALAQLSGRLSNITAPAPPLL